jgi:hypothetical protein
VLHNFRDAYDCYFGIIGDDLHAGFPHLRPAHPEDLNVQAGLQRFGQTRSIHVSGSFPGGKKDRNGWHYEMEA